MDMKDIDIVIGDTDITIPTGEERVRAPRRSATGAQCTKRAGFCRRSWKRTRRSRARAGTQNTTSARRSASPIGNFKGAEEKGVKYRNFPAYAYATQAAIVEVDTATGKVKLLKVIAAHDVGRAINPRIIEGQMQGSVSMGQGYALTEGHPTKNGYPVKKLYGQMGLPKAEDTPRYKLILIEDPEPIGPYGAKGVSEVATVPITPAILNAVSRAVGVRINKVPASPGGHSGGHPHREMRCSHHGRAGLPLSLN